MHYAEKDKHRQRLRANKFSLVSKQWDPFKTVRIVVSQRQISQLTNKSNELGLKFWPAPDVKSKSVLNEFSYFGKDETTPDQAHWMSKSF